MLTTVVDDIAGAEGLRYQLLRLLDPPAKSDASYNVQAVKDVAENSRGRAVALCTMFMIDQYLSRLITEQRETAYDGLSAVVEEAATLSWTFSTRKAVVKVPSWATMMETEPNAMSYAAGFQIFEPHVMHNMVLEDDPEALDGQEIVLNCSPMVMLMGNAEGEDYHKRKVLKKAVVWLG